MLIRMTPDQVAEYWEAVKMSLEESLPDHLDENAINNILEAMLIGSIQAWVSIRKDTKEVVGIITTTLSEDQVSETKSLLMYSMYTFIQSNAQDWMEGFSTLSKFAKALGCHNMIAYTENPEIRKIASHYKAKESTLLTFNLR